MNLNFAICYNFSDYVPVLKSFSSERNLKWTNKSLEKLPQSHSNSSLYLFPVIDGYSLYLTNMRPIKIVSTRNPQMNSMIYVILNNNVRDYKDYTPNFTHLIRIAVEYRKYRIRSVRVTYWFAYIFL